MDFQHVDKFASNALSILESARMPWHDVRNFVALLTGCGVEDCE